MKKEQREKERERTRRDRDKKKKQREKEKEKEREREREKDAIIWLRILCHQPITDFKLSLVAIPTFKVIIRLSYETSLVIIWLLIPYISNKS